MYHTVANRRAPQLPAAGRAPPAGTGRSSFPAFRRPTYACTGRNSFLCRSLLTSVRETHTRRGRTREVRRGPTLTAETANSWRIVYCDPNRRTCPRSRKLPAPVLTRDEPMLAMRGAPSVLFRCRSGCHTRGALKARLRRRVMHWRRQRRWRQQRLPRQLPLRYTQPPSAKISLLHAPAGGSLKMIKWRQQ